MDCFTLTFYGTRGTRTVCGKQYLEFGGHTTCMAVRAASRLLVFDSGSGIVQLGKDEVTRHRASEGGGPLLTYLFQTHCHHDHISGFPYFTPFYLRNSTSYVFGPRSPVMGFEEAMTTFLHTPYHPVPIYEMPGKIVWGEVREPYAYYFVAGQEVPVVVNSCHSEQRKNAPKDAEVVVRCLRGYNHPKGGVMFYRVEHQNRSIVIATDTEGYVHGDQRLVRFAAKADVLVHDGMYTDEAYTSGVAPTQGWGHSTVGTALDVAKQANVRRLFLVHHEPEHGDETLAQIESDAQAELACAAVARDGLVIDLLEP